MSRTHPAAVLFALPLLFIAGCGGGTSSGSGPGSSAQLSLSATTLAFGNVMVGQTSPAQTLTISNTGNATLSVSSITLTGTNSGAFAETTTCGSSLAAGTSCTVAATFKPTAAGSDSATITVTDNAAGSPHTVSVTGTGTVVTLPQVTLSPTSLTFGTIGAGTASAPQTVTLTNSGNATLTNLAVSLTGTNVAQFAETTTCTSTLAANASCAVAVTFTAAVTAKNYTATLSFADNALPSPQTVSLSGAAAGTVSFALYTFPESDNSATPLYALVNNAQKTIDMTMYALQDTTFTNDLIAACKRGVVVRVILDQNNEKSNNTPAFTTLNGGQANCSAVWANKAFMSTHEKSIVIDGTLVAIMSLNLQSQYYSTTRDFAVVENDAADIAAIEATFNADYAAGTTSTGTVGASDFGSVPAIGDDLIWSPTTAQTAMVNIIANAQKTLLIENEEMANSASYIVSALEAACKKGVTVQIAMVDQSSYEANFTALEAAGCGVHVYPDTTTGFYIHAKAVIADYGLSTQSVYMGSINYSNASMNLNRELGMYISDPVSVQSLNTTMSADYAGGHAY